MVDNCVLHLKNNLHHLMFHQLITMNHHFNMQQLILHQLYLNQVHYLI